MDNNNDLFRGIVDVNRNRSLDGIRRDTQAQTAELRKQNENLEQLKRLEAAKLQFAQQQKQEADLEKLRVSELPKCPACLASLEGTPRKCRQCGIELKVAQLAKNNDFQSVEADLSAFERVPNHNEDWKIKIFYDSASSLSDQVTQQITDLENEIMSLVKTSNEVGFDLHDGVKKIESTHQKQKKDKAKLGNSKQVKRWLRLVNQENPALAYWGMGGVYTAILLIMLVSSANLGVNEGTEWFFGLICLLFALGIGWSINGIVRLKSAKFKIATRYVETSHILNEWEDAIGVLEKYQDRNRLLHSWLKSKYDTLKQIQAKMNA